MQDLLREEVPKEQRHIVFQFLCNLAQGQADKLGNLRAQFFRLVATHTLREDIGPRLDLLRAITDNGKDIQYIDTEVSPSHFHPFYVFLKKILNQVAPFLLSWMSEVSHANKTNDLLSLLVNVVKFNAAFVEDDVISGLIEYASLKECTSNILTILLSRNSCFLCSWSQQDEVVLSSMALLDVIVCYAQMPPDMLPTFVCTLCNCVNNRAYCQSSWKVRS